MKDFKRIKSAEDLQKDFENKIDYLREQVKLARELELNSNIRNEFGNNIAVTLRAMLCYSGGISLARRTKYGKELLFPLRDGRIALNLIPSYTLVGFKISNNFGTVEASNVILENKVYSTYLGFEKWIHEIIIDFKTPDCPPISRYKLIKVVADKLGAHVDETIDEFLCKVLRENSFPFVITTEKGETINTSGRNLFSESIIAIAEELIYAYDFTYQCKMKLYGISDFGLYIQTFEDSKKTQEKSYKYLISAKDCNAYNSNKYFECIVEKKVLHNYVLKYRHMKFIVDIID